jgi:hypothetical protein
MEADRSRSNNQTFALTRAAAQTESGKLLLSVVLSALFVTVLFVLFPARQIPVFSNWSGPATISASAMPQPEAEGQPADTSPQGAKTNSSLPGDALDRYNPGSALQDADSSGAVSFYRRELPGGGTLAYFVAMLDEHVHFEVVNADGATPGSDAAGDTIWADGQRHLATVAEMVSAGYAARDGMELLGAMAFGFHGDARTSDEGTVVINGQILRVNAGRGTLCITKDGHARIGLFDRNQLAECQQAAGAGPVILWNGKIANPAVSDETEQFVPYNPLGEDFVQLDWRRKIYSGLYPKTAVGVGERDGRSYLVMIVSYGVSGVDLAAHLRDMGCTAALGGDDDTSTQAVWRGSPVRNGALREVPDALALYVRR